MTYSNPTLGKEVAWNGIRFLSPVDWEIGKIGNHYLMLEDEAGPMMEVKWHRIKGHFSPQAQLHRLSALHKNKPGRNIKQIPVPSGWKEVIDRFESLCFSWYGETMGGRGVVLYCPKCQNSTLMQFFQRKIHVIDKITTQLLASFQDHRQDDQIDWAVFDITARIPREFQLVKYRFEAGLFELTFVCRGNKVTLYRWGPASILLRERDLLQNASKMFGISHADLKYSKIDGRNMVDSNIYPSSSAWVRISNFIKLNPLYNKSRIWHLEDKNRLLGVKMDGRQPIDPSVFEQICGFYDSV